jgi:CubicO group peptidase (beta-lactamase class C family)
MAAFAQLLDTAKIIGSLLMRGDLAAIKRISKVNTLFDPRNIVGNFTDMQSLFFHQPTVFHPTTPHPLLANPATIPASFTYQNKTYDLATWQAQRKICAMVVLKNGQIAYEQYFQGTKPDDQRISWSMSKSILSATFGILHDQGLIPNLDTEIGTIVPALKGSAYECATIRNVLNMASGVAFNEDYLDYHSDINRMGRILAIGGSMDTFAAGLTRRQWKPGTYNHYVSIDTHVIGMIMRAITGRGTNELVSELLFQPMGLEGKPYFLTDSLGEPFVLGGLNMTTRDYARFGLLFAQGGQLNGKQIVSANWVKTSTAQSAPPPDPETANTPEGVFGYGYQWWLPPQAEDDEFFAIGIYGQYIYINTRLQTVIAMNGADTGFRDGDGLIAQTNIALCRQIATALE